MEDGVGAVPLKRPRATASRGASGPPARRQEKTSSAVPMLLSSPRPLWLAALGAGAIAARVVTVTWNRLIVEGTQAEAELRARLTPSKAE